jgi:hypothetical protein
MFTALYQPASYPESTPYKRPLMGGAVSEILGEVTLYSTVATEWEKCNVTFSIKLQFVIMYEFSNTKQISLVH